MLSPADAADRAGTNAATARIDFENDHLGRLPRSGRAGHIKEIRQLADGAAAYGEYARQHKHFSKRGSAREWDEKYPSYQMSKEEFEEREDEIEREQRRCAHIPLLTTAQILVNPSIQELNVLTSASNRAKDNIKKEKASEVVKSYPMADTSGLASVEAAVDTGASTSRSIWTRTISMTFTTITDDFVIGAIDTLYLLMISCLRGSRVRE